MSDPNISTLIANGVVKSAASEAKTLAGWLKAQVLGVWQDHKVAAVVIAACSFVAGCIIR